MRVTHRREMNTEFWLETLEESYRFEATDMDGTLILKQILKQ
jgi:hypothetical protein